MLKFVDAAIPMVSHLRNIEVLSGLPDVLSSEVFLPPTEPFSEDTIDFLEALSKHLISSIDIHQYPNITTFAFFCRKANLRKIKHKLVAPSELELGRGLVFHVAPSNVAINFAYSMIIGLLAGNNNIIKVPSRSFAEIDILVEAVNKVTDNTKHQHITKRNLLVRYDRSDSSSTEYFSKICDVRIIWGGDDTINNIRKHPLKPKAYDITFADRYSISVIEAKQFIAESQKTKVANSFFNDTYLIDQKACTSPHLLVWVGKKSIIKEAKQLFWNELHKIVQLNYTLESIAAIDKLTTLCNQAIAMPTILLEKKQDNLIWRIKLNELNSDIENWRCHSGYFSEYETSDLSKISKIITPKYQTLTYYGFSKEHLTEFIQNQKPIGIDRIVPIGKAMNFSFTWDGFKLIESLSRTISINT